jgi:hypothetical protein
MFSIKKSCSPFQLNLDELPYGMISFPKDFCFLDIIGAFSLGFATNGNEGDLDPRAYSISHATL